MNNKSSLVARTLPTRIGDMTVVALDEGVCLTEFSDGHYLHQRLKRVDRLFRDRSQCDADRWVELLAQQLEQYLAGRRQRFEIPMIMGGTPFQNRVWKVLNSTTYGEVLTYRELAERAGKSSAVRAAAAANGANPLAVLVPCHRIVGMRGKLTGYGGGVERKAWLLALEAGRQPVWQEPKDSPGAPGTLERLSADSVH